jgi:hypothetical protein
MADTDTIGYRVTRTGIVNPYRISADGMIRIAYLADSPPPVPPIPDWLVPAPGKGPP